MLKHLFINNIILIETADIRFEEGLNVISGETGSGKSAVMDALRLVIGERADTSIIRKGSEKGVVDARFDIDGLPAVKALLDESGIDHQDGEELIIRREINASGKSRAFINNQSAQITLLKKLGELLMDVMEQHANQRLLSIENHRHLIDLFGNLEKKGNAFSRSWEEENRIRCALEELVKGEAQRLRDIEVCRMELEEIQEAGVKEGEDEQLFAEYTLLSSSGELAQHADSILQALMGEKFSALAALSRQRASFEQLRTVDPTLDDAAKAFNDALIELEEVANTLRNYQSRIDHNPARAEAINQRLTAISRLKRKYGPEASDIIEYEKTASERLHQMENADTQIDALKEELEVLAQQNDLLAKELSAERKKCALAFEKGIVKELRALNMPKVEFEVEFTPQKRSRTGDDRIEFFLIPNTGEHRIPIRECASGGELSRLMLALQTLLAGKEHTPTLIFDEIDANIGGETAVIVGEKLKEISSKHQVLCITHFPQVATYAHHHLQIFKTEVAGRTHTMIKHLDEESRRSELIRMHGGTKIAVD